MFSEPFVLKKKYFNYKTSTQQQLLNEKKTVLGLKSNVQNFGTVLNSLIIKENFSRQLYTCRSLSFKKKMWNQLKNFNLV